MKKKAPKESVAKTSAYITRTESFAAKIKKVGYNNSLVVLSQKWYHNQLNKFKDGEQVTLEVHNRKAKRTEQQNRYYFGVYLPLIASEKGDGDLDALHEYFKGKFLTKEIKEVLGEKVRIKKSTTDLGVGEFCEYIMNIENLTQVTAPPTENYDLAPLRGDIHSEPSQSDDSLL